MAHPPLKRYKDKKNVQKRNETQQFYFAGENYATTSTMQCVRYEVCHSVHDSVRHRNVGHQSSPHHLPDLAVKLKRFHHCTEKPTYPKICYIRWKRDNESILH